MSQENVELVKQVYDAFAHRDAATVLACYDPKIEWDNSGSPLTRLIGGRRVYRGHEGLRRFFREWYEAWETVEYDYDELIDAGDEHVISVDTMRGRGRASGVEVEWHHAGVWTIREGKVVKVVWLRTREQALQAAGLSESATSQENAEIVRRVYEAVARRDTATVLAAYDPDVEWDLSRSLWGDLTGRAVYRGHEDLRAFYREWYEAWGRYDEAVEELIEAGEHVIVVATGRGRGRASGAEVGWTQYGVWTMREGKIVRVAWFGTREAALEAAGLSE